MQGLRRLESAVTVEESGQRIDRYLARRFPDLSRSRIQTLIENGYVTISNRKVKQSQAVRTGEIIILEIPEIISSDLAPEDIPIEILFEDHDLIAIAKPRGMVVHPGAGVDHGTLVHAVLHHCRDLSGIGGKSRPGIVHRLDKGTSGVILIAKNDFTHHHLSKQFSERRIKKEYLAIVHGDVSWTAVTIDAGIARHPVHRKKMCISDKGRPARTAFQRLATGPESSLILAKPESGRTHQIRVHLLHAGCPVLGDPLYGAGRMPHLKNASLKQYLKMLNGFCLHAHKLAFRHPRTDELLDLKAPLPQDFLYLLQLCGIECPPYLSSGNI
jgi:23S rRNA pseudouridine1911/1915/1917 synthase